MKYSATITADIPADDILQVIKAEQDSSYSRASWTVKEEGGRISFDVTAQDSVALRAMLTSITKILTIYEKIKKIR